VVGRIGALLALVVVLTVACGDVTISAHRDALRLPEPQQRPYILSTPQPPPPPPRPVTRSYAPRPYVPPPCNPPTCGIYGRLVIPAGHINAPLEYIGLEGCCRMGVPRGIWDAGLYGLGPMPGGPGTAIIDGHNHWYNGPVLFWTLAQDVHPGDAVVVAKTGGPTYTYSISTTTVIPWTAPLDPYMSDSGPSRLLIITCSGTWDTKIHEYTTRTLIGADLVG